MRVFLATGIVIAALWPIFLNLATGMNIFEFLFFEYLISVPASLLLVFLFKKQKSLVEILRNRKMLAIIALISLLNYGFQDFGMLYAEHFITPSLASVIFNSYPIMMLLFLPVVIKEKVSRYQLLALGLGFIGICIIFGGGASTGLESVNIFGVLLALAVSITTALSLSMVKRYVVDIQNAIFFFCTFSLVMFSITYFLAGMPTNPLTFPEILSIVYSGIIYSVIFGFIYYMALNTLKTTKVTNFYFLAPFLTFVFSYIFLGEQIPPYYLLTAVFISVGILVQEFDTKGGSYKPPEGIELDNLQLFDVTGVFSNTKEMVISSAIEEGGRVFATKLEKIHRGLIEELTHSGLYPKVYTDKSDAIKDESIFVRNLVHARNHDMIVIIAGREGESMIFFKALSKNVTETDMKKSKGP